MTRSKAFFKVLKGHNRRFRKLVQFSVAKQKLRQPPWEALPVQFSTLYAFQAPSAITTLTSTHYPETILVCFLHFAPLHSESSSSMENFCSLIVSISKLYPHSPARATTTRTHLRSSLSFLKLKGDRLYSYSIYLLLYFSFFISFCLWNVNFYGLFSCRLC